MSFQNPWIKNMFLSLKHLSTCSMVFVRGKSRCYRVLSSVPSTLPNVFQFPKQSHLRVTSQRFLWLRSLSLEDLRIGNVVEKPPVSRRGRQEDNVAWQSLQLKKRGSRKSQGHHTTQEIDPLCSSVCEASCNTCVRQTRVHTQPSQLKGQFCSCSEPSKPRTIYGTEWNFSQC